MGNELIPYHKLKERWNVNDIILGNKWDKGREKNIISTKNINIMGVHNIYENFSNEKIKYNLDNNFFYHILNFKEKYREELMTQYIFL